jgi:hypothetical protein
LETILNSDAKQILPKINDAVSPENLKNYQYKSYKIETELVNGIKDIKEFIEDGK